MKQYKIIFCLLYIWLPAMLCTGCGEATRKEAASVSYAAAGMENTPVINYVVPEVFPNILVNQEGYLAKGRKEATVKGKELPKQFRLVNAETEETVYTGFIKDAMYNEELDIYIGNAVFTDFTGEGVFFLECDKIGRSLNFVLDDRMYYDLFQESYGDLMEACRQQTIEMEDLVALLTVYEWYPEIFTDEDADEIPDVLEEIAKWIALKEESGEQNDSDSMYVAVLAKFSYIYQRYDVRYATECLQRASGIFAQRKELAGRDAEKFLALTELYRTSGMSTYRNQIRDYTDFFEKNSSFMEEVAYLYGAMTYMATRQTVDVELCNTFMERLMTRAEEVSERYEDMIHPVTAKNNGSNDLLKRVRELAYANYVLKNYQYTNIMEAFLNYLCGENKDSLCYYVEEESRLEYIFLLAQLAAIYKE